MSEPSEQPTPRWSARSVWLALSAAATIAIAPALFGTWVYDDHALPTQPLYARWSDVLLAFVRSSDDYFRAIHAEEPLASGGHSWRPVPNALFAVVNASVGPSALAHHLVSLSAHCAALFALVRWAARDGLVRRAHALFIAVFAVHPALIEAYAYINGRSDAMAGAALAASAVAMKRERWRWMFAALLVAVASKETSIVASFFIVAAFARGEHSSASDVDAQARALGGRSRARPWLAWLAAITIGVGARVLVVGSRGTIRSDASIPALFSAALRWTSIATESLLLPSLRAMRLLSWELSAPWSLRAAFGVLVAAAIVALSRGWTARVLVLGAIVSAAPAIVVSNAFWMGSDRYLYQPAVLLLLAALSTSAQRAQAIERRATPLLTAVGALTLMVLTALSSMSYRSERWFAATMRDARPDDPTGYIVGAREAIVISDLGEARALLAKTEGQRVVATQAHRIIMLAISLGDLSLADRTLRTQQASAPLTPRLAADLYDLRARQGRWDDATRAARTLLDASGSERAQRARVLRAIVRNWPAATQREAAQHRIVDGLR